MALAAWQVGIQEELDLKGINHIGGPADAGKVVDLSPGVYLEHDHDVSAACTAGGAMHGCSVRSKRTVHGRSVGSWRGLQRGWGSGRLGAQHTGQGRWQQEALAMAAAGGNGGATVLQWKPCTARIASRWRLALTSNINH